jgi:hypothetical protein
MIVDVITTIFEGLEDNVRLNAACQEMFGKNLAVLFGVQKEKPIGIDDAPAILVGTPKIKLANVDRQYTIPFALGIANSAVVANRYYAGARDIARLAELVCEELVLLPLKITVEAEVPPITDTFPLFYCFLTAVVDKRNPVRPQR